MPGGSDPGLPLELRGRSTPTGRRPRSTSDEERLQARLQCPQLARRSVPLQFERREFLLSQCPPPVHESVRAKAGRPLWEAACHRGIGRFVPPRHACAASARFLRYAGSPTSESFYPRFISLVADTL